MSLIDKITNPWPQLKGPVNCGSVNLNLYLHTIMSNRALLTHKTDTPTLGQRLLLAMNFLNNMGISFKSILY